MVRPSGMAGEKGTKVCRDCVKEEDSCGIERNTKKWEDGGKFLREEKIFSPIL